MKTSVITLVLVAGLLFTGCSPKQEISHPENSQEESSTVFKKQESTEGTLAYRVDDSIPLTEEDMISFYQNEMTDNSVRHIVKYGNYTIEFKVQSYGVFRVFEETENQNRWILKGRIKEDKILTGEVDKLWSPTLDEVKEVTNSISGVSLSQINEKNGLIEIDLFAKDMLTSKEFSQKAKDVFATIAKELNKHEAFYQLDGLSLTLSNDESHAQTVTIYLASDYLLSDSWESYLMTQSASSISTDKFTYIEKFQ